MSPAPDAVARHRGSAQLGRDVGTRSRPGRAGRGEHQRRIAVALAMLTPALVGALVFFAYPLVMTTLYAFTSFDLSNAPRWNDFANWKYMFGGDKQILQAAGNTLWFVVFMVPARLVGALFTAWMLTRARRTAGLLRTVYYIPALIPPVASTLGFVFVFKPGSGPVDQLLQLVNLQGTGWFTSPTWSKPSLLMLGVWVMGDVMVLFLASLLDVPREQYEAAELDGASTAQQFRYVTLPAMAPIILFNLITGIIAALKYFTEPAVASAVAQGKASVGAGASTFLGWPAGSTLTYGQEIYQKAFGAHLMGYASAMAVVLFLVTLAIMVVLLRRFRAFTPESAS